MSIVRAVARLDPADADVLVAFTLGELAMDYGEMASFDEAEDVAKSLPELRRVLVRKFVARRATGEPVDDLVNLAARMTLAERETIEKFRPERVWRESDVKRDENGRFAREFSSTTATIPHDSMKGPHYGPRNMKDLADAKSHSKRQLNSYAEDWARLHGEIETLRSTGAIDRDKAKMGLKLQDRRSGRRYEVPIGTTADASWDPKMEKPVGYSWDEGSPVGMGEGNRPQLATLGASLNRTPSAEAPNAMRYQQAGMAGQAIRQLTRPGTVPHAAGMLASVVGEMGPQAEEAIGPTMRRTAYRYRGNEVRPSAGVRLAVEQVDEVGLIMDDQMRLAGVDPATNPPASKLRQNTPAESAVYMYGKEFGDNPARVSMHGRSDQAALELVDDIPTPEQYELGLASGTPPPSTGVMIDSQGRVAHQAVGYEGDHYLPFNLRNLKALSGGQYVRTRGTGGPTSEDIYTGLMGNARMITVASRNGVFTLEFAPETRGSKRYSDKARRMIRRYEQILDTVDTSGGGRLRRTEVSEEAQDRIKQRAWVRANGDIETYKTFVETELAKERFKLEQGIGTDKKALRAQAEEEMRQGYSAQAWMKLPNATREGMVSERMRAITEESGATGGSYRLNGPGYASALSALQRQFPDLIRRVEYRTLKDFGDSFGMGPEFAMTAQPSRGARDKGYVLPGSNKPHEAAVGWWNQNITRGSVTPGVNVQGDTFTGQGPKGHSKQRGTWAEPGMTHRRPPLKEEGATATRPAAAAAAAAGGAGAGAGGAAPAAGGKQGAATLNPNGLAAGLLGRSLQALPLLQNQIQIMGGISSLTPGENNADIVPVDPTGIEGSVAQQSVARIRGEDAPVVAKWMLDNATLSESDPRLAEALRDPVMTKKLSIWMNSVANRLRDPSTAPALLSAMGISNLTPDVVANNLQKQAKEIEDLSSQSQPLRAGNPLTDDPSVNGVLRPVVTPAVDALAPDESSVSNYLDNDLHDDAKKIYAALDSDSTRDALVEEHRKQGRRIAAMVAWQSGPQAAYLRSSGLSDDDARALGLTQVPGKLSDQDKQDVAAQAQALTEAVRSGDVTGLPDVGSDPHPLMVQQHRAEALALWAAGKALAGEPIPKVSKGLGSRPVPLRPAGLSSARGTSSRSPHPVRKRQPSRLVVHSPDSPLARAVASRLT